ncbi:amino acid ABC transporter substrate-binding protein, PAAT family [Colwellia chukchiensis]|uniref:Amino acid ABC transporter substrate-binding protein, PAAT family n=1 Tax=Colwellia chukchiensis TaxID=641665 RepID=A0A1H7TEI3_9GAMM|nr:transporter substrate-binding domain-containing protein [Colwellia chukchiensis]SEL82257.1 amino acid ABC transporter substrate-binding protein, PAAT family [Colwellia chukchiensis]
MIEYPSQVIANHQQSKQWQLWRQILIVLLLILMIYSGAAQALSTADSKARLSQVVLATGTHYSPFIDSRLPNGGWSSAIVKAVFQQLNITLTIKPLPWSRVLASTEMNHVDGAFPYISTEQRHNDFYYSEPINYVPIKIIAQQNVKATTVSDLKVYTFCLPYGFSSAQDFLAIVTDKNTTHAPTTRDCLDKVLSGWADVVLVNQYNSILQNKQYQSLKVLPMSVAQEPLHFIVAKSHPDAHNLIRLFNQGLQSIKQNQVLDSINQAYLRLLASKEKSMAKH